MGRKKLNRVTPLYLRTSSENADFVKKLSKLAGMNKTQWMDSHLNYLRKNYKTLAYQHVEKRRD